MSIKHFLNSNLICILQLISFESPPSFFKNMHTMLKYSPHFPSAAQQNLAQEVQVYYFNREANRKWLYNFTFNSYSIPKCIHPVGSFWPLAIVTRIIFSNCKQNRIKGGNFINGKSVYCTTFKKIIMHTNFPNFLREKINK